MGGKVKRCGYKNGQGYCGWYINKDGKRMFLRSTKEFIYANYLDSNGVHFLTEKSTFDISGRMYKPDFFIYDDTYKNLTKIIEVKDTKKKAMNYINFFSEFFKGIKIKYEVVWEFRKISKDLVLENKIKEWIENFEKTYDRLSVSGENNPMWGMKHSKKTKRLIGKRTKEYMQDPDVKRKHSSSIKSFWSSDAALETKEKYRKLRRAEKTIRDQRINDINPFINKKCVCCGGVFVDRKLGKKKTCTGGCSQKYNWEIGIMKYRGDGKKSYKTKMLNYAKKIWGSNIDESNLQTKIQKAKIDGIIPKNFSMSVDVIGKYFGSINNLIGEIKNG